ncbi:hypothetical protein D9M71_592910 [compost metagenome]
MSLANAWAFCCATFGCPAFQPKRPSTVCWRLSSHTRLARPRMPSPLRSSGSALARISASGIASSRPRPITGGATRAENMVSGCIGP